MNVEPLKELEPYLLRGEQRYRVVPTWHHSVQRTALVVAEHLDRWHAGFPELECEVFNHAAFLLRNHPPTAVRIPLTVVRGRFPTLESDWVPALPLIAIEVMIGPTRYGDLEDWVEEYLECGVPAVWVLYPNSKTMTVHRSGVSAIATDSYRDITGDPELPGFSCRVADFFR